MTGNVAQNMMPLAVVSSFDLPDESRIERVTNREGHVRWAVRSYGSCLNAQGQWEDEPSPSNRDDSFIARCRFETAEAAYQVWQQTPEVKQQLHVDDTEETTPNPMPRHGADIAGACIGQATSTRAQMEEFMAQAKRRIQGRAREINGYFAQARKKSGI